jgi:hypothetical protein
MKRRRSQHHSRLRSALYGLVVCALSLLVVEGFSSALVVGHTVWRVLLPSEERVHTTHDAELGWTNIPNFVRRGMYGPSAGLSIDARGFRAVPSPPAAALPRLRVICSGDSFTFGVGVGDADTWCHHLTSIDARISTTNMGQIGYGVDQAFLWYRRNASEVPHDVQVLAFVSADFDRMRDATFMSYSKPILAIEDGNLVVRNGPVPYRSTAGRMLERARGALSTFRMAEVLNFLFRKPTGGSVRAAPESVADLRPVVAKTIETLRDLHARQHTTLVLAFLPVRTDFADERSAPWRQAVREIAGSEIPLVDVVTDLRTLPVEEVDQMFIGPGAAEYGLAEGQYSQRGHAVVASAIHRAITEIDAVKARLGDAAPLR